MRGGGGREGVQGHILMLRRSCDWTQRRRLGWPETAPPHHGWSSILTHTHPEPQDGSLFENRVLAEVITVGVRSLWLVGQAVQHLVSS